MPVWEAGQQLVGAKGASKSRHELLEQAKADRDARKTERLKLQAVVRIQSAWRSYRARVFAVHTVCRQITSTFRDAVPSAVGGPGKGSVPACTLLCDIIARLAALCNRHRQGSVFEHPTPRCCRNELHQALSTALSLSIRSLTTPEHQDSLLHVSPSHAKIAAWAWPSFGLLCARVANVQITDNEALAAAAARCAYLLLSARVPGPTPNDQTVTSRQNSLPYRTAVILAESPVLFRAAEVSLSSDTSAGRPCNLEYPSATDAAPAATMRERLRANLLRSIVMTFELLSPGDTDITRYKSATAEGTSLSVACKNLVSTVLTSPATLVHFSAISAALERSKRQVFLTLFVYLASSQPGGLGNPHPPATALMALTTLMAGPKQTLPDTTPQALSTLQPCPMMKDPPVAQAFLAACAGVLAGVRSAGPPQDPLLQRLLQQQWWPFTQNVFLLDLLHSSKADLSSWPPPATSDTDGEWDGLDAIIGIYHALIQMAADAPMCSDTFVSLLAYHAPWMRALWRRVALRCALPLEVPAEAVRGSEVASLHDGVAAFSPAQTACLHVFCELLSHVLVVLDDEAFHKGGDPLTLPAFRAVALSLNSLVFHSCMHSCAAARPARPHRALLALACKCLQQLHSRHVRRSYCADAAWLAPWAAWSNENSGQQAELALTGAVLRVMLARASEDEAEASSARDCGGPAAAVVELLQMAPHSVPYALRVDMFRQLLSMDKEESTWVLGQGRAGLKVKVSRRSVLEDAFSQLAPLGSRIKQPFMVVFVDAHGSQEAGIDQGGLLKELLESILHQGFDANFGLVQFTADGKAFPSPLAPRVPNGLSLLEFLGLAVGKALYEGMLLDIELASLFVMALQQRHPALEDLFTLDEDLYRALIQIKNYAGDASDLGLYFVVEEDVLGRTVEHELMPRGRDLPVTDENKLMYVYLCAHWHISRINSAAAQAFSAGLSKVIPISFLRMFTVVEVNELLGGTAGADGMDIDDMQAHCHYKGGYSKSSSTVRMFWRVVASFDAEQRRLLLKFVTGTRRAPLGGFANMAPPLVVHKIHCEASPFARLGGPDVERLPTASTCFSLLKLPNYRRASTMRKKLLYAITAKAGFDLS